MSGLLASWRALARMAVVIVLVTAGSTILVRLAPGYLSDAREMDPRYADVARDQIAVEAARSVSVIGMMQCEIGHWLRRDLGTSRQYDVSVIELIKPRLGVTVSLLLRSMFLAWTVAGCAAGISNWGRQCGRLCQITSTIVLAVPVGAMATLCLLADGGGPLLVMTTRLAAKDFKFLDRMLRKAWRDPHLLQARAQGIHSLRLMWVHLFPGILPQLGSLATLSILTALGAIVPVEVIFSTPGIGQLAWNAAMNRDLPVLLATTMLMAVAVTGSGIGARVAPALDWKTA